MVLSAIGSRDEFGDGALLLEPEDKGGDIAGVIVHPSEVGELAADLLGPFAQSPMGVEERRNVPRRSCELCQIG